MRDLSRLAARVVLPLVVPVGGLAVAITTGLVVPTMVTACMFVVAHMVTLPNPGGGRLSLSAMVAVAAWLLTESGWVVLGGAALGMPAGWVLIRLRLGPRAAESLFPAEPAALVAATAVFAAGHEVLHWVDLGTEVAHLALVTLAGAVWYLVAATIRALTGRRSRRTFRRMLWWEALGDGPAYLALVAAGTMYGVAYPSMRWWAVPLALLPYGFSHLSLLRLAETRRTYRQTIVALGRIPEAGGYVNDGHAGRTADLARSIGAELGFGPFRVQRVEYAALLHDVGRVVLNDPSIAEYTARDLAQWSAAIISESVNLGPVATVVARHQDPYRRAGEERNPELPREAQVVRVAARFDHAIAGEGLSTPDALEVLHQGAAYDFDPEIVAALRRVLQRRAVGGV